MNLSQVFDCRLPSKQAGPPAYEFLSKTDERTNRVKSLLWVESCNNIKPVASASSWVGRLPTQHSLTQYAIGSIINGQSCAILGVKQSKQVFEAAVSTSLFVLNQYKYPQAIIIVKETKLFKELSPRIKAIQPKDHKLNCVHPTLSIVCCLDAKFSQLKIELKQVMLITLLGDFSLEQINQFNTYRKSYNQLNTLFLISQPLSLQTLNPQPQNILNSIDSKTFQAFTQIYDSVVARDILPLSQCQSDLWMLLVCLYKDNLNNILIFTSRKQLDKVNKFLRLNFSELKAEDIQQMGSDKYPKHVVIGYGVRLQLSPHKCLKVVELKDDSNSSMAASFLKEEYLDVSAEFNSKFIDNGHLVQVDRKPQPKRQNFSKKKTGQEIPLTLTEFMVNKTWVRITLDKYLQTPNPLIVMNRQYIRPPAQPGMLKTPFNSNLLVFSSSSHRSKVILLKNQLSQQLLNQVLLKVSDNGQAKVCFYDSPKLPAERLLGYLPSCNALTKRECVAVIYILFFDSGEMLQSIRSIFS